MIHTRCLILEENTTAKKYTNKIRMQWYSMLQKGDVLLYDRDWLHNITVVFEKENNSYFDGCSRCVFHGYQAKIIGNLNRV